MNKSAAGREIINHKDLSGGWWEFYLSCGHGGKILLGQAWDPGLNRMKCKYCGDYSTKKRSVENKPIGLESESSHPTREV